MQKKDGRLCIRINKDVLKKLKALAEKSKRKFSNYIQLIFDDHVKGKHVK